MVDGRMACVAASEIFPSAYVLCVVRVMCPGVLQRKSATTAAYAASPAVIFPV